MNGNFVNRSRQTSARNVNIEKQSNDFIFCTKNGYEGIVIFKKIVILHILFIHILSYRAIFKNQIFIKEQLDNMYRYGTVN